MGSESPNAVLDVIIEMVKKLHVPKRAIVICVISSSCFAGLAHAPVDGDGNVFASPLAVAARVLERINYVQQAKLAVERAAEIC